MCKSIQTKNTTQKTTKMVMSEEVQTWARMITTAKSQNTVGEARMTIREEFTGAEAAIRSISPIQLSTLTSNKSTRETLQQAPTTLLFTLAEEGADLEK